MKLIKNDEVIVIKGKDKGKTAKIEKVFPKDGKVLLPGINQFKRHIKAKRQGEKSEIKTISKPLAMASVAFVCPNCHKKSRIGFVIDKDQKKRVCKKCNKII